MAQVRLRTNMMIDAKLHKRGTVLDLSLVPERWRDSDHIDRDLQNTEGRVLVLRDLGFPSIPKPDSEGIPTSYPVHVIAGQLLDLSTVPASYRESLKAGSDYKTDWTYEEQEQDRAGVTLDRHKPACVQQALQARGPDNPLYGVLGEQFRHNLKRFRSCTGTGARR